MFYHPERYFASMKGLDMINTTIDYLQIVLIQPMLRLTISIFEGVWYKVILTSLLYLTGLIYDNNTAYFTLLFFIIADTFTGIWAALVRGEKLSSRKFRFSVVKIILYSLLISSFYQLENLSVIFRELNLDTVVLNYLAVTELLSIMENISTVTHMKYPNWLTKKLSAFITTGKADDTDHITK